MPRAGEASLNRDIKNLLALKRCVQFPEGHLFNRVIDIALGEGVEAVMTSIPPDYWAPFREWIDRMLASLDTLINLKTGPLSEHEKETIRAIGEWFERHPAEDRPHGEGAGTSANGMNAGDWLQPVGDSGSPVV
jgi:hypothetical protein